jgi:hypothetical protein
MNATLTGIELSIGLILGAWIVWAVGWTIKMMGVRGDDKERKDRSRRYRG